MDRIALHTKVSRGKEAEYAQAHAAMPVELTDALREAGAHSWRIWRDGQDLFHVVECDDYQQMRAFLRDHPANLPWQQRMSALLDVEDDYSGEDSGIEQVWELPPL